MLASLLAFTLTPIPPAAAQGANLLANPQVRPGSDGWSTWARKGEPTFVFDDAVGHGDTSSLRITSDAEGVDGAWLQGVACEGDTPYEHSFWFRAEAGLERISVLVEFTSPEGAYLGQYRREIAAEGEEWTRAEGLFVAPPKASSMSFGLWVNLDNVGPGTAWFDDFSLRPSARPILRFDVTSPVHRLLGPDDDMVRCVLAQTNPAAGTVTYAVALRSGEIVLAEDASETDGEARIELPAPEEEGVYTLAIQISHDGGTAFESEDIILRRAEPPKVAIGRHRELLVEGEPFFPIGVYWTRIEDLADVAANGFNCTHAWQYPTEEGHAFFDEAERCGLSVLLEMSDTLRGKTDLETIRARVEGFREHPALLVHYPVDEPSPRSLDPAAMREAYNLVKRLDPDHPVMYVQCNMAHLAPYISATDIQGVDPYGPPVLVRDWVTVSSEASGDSKPVWSVIGTFPWAGDGEGLPSAEYVRCATYVSLICGAKGLLYFTYHFDQHNLGESPLWGPLGRLNREVTDLAPWLLACEPTPVQASNELVEAALFTDGDTAVLLAANTSEDAEVEVDLALPGFTGEARELFGDDVHTCVEGLSLSLPAYGVAAIRLPAKPRP